MNIYDTDIKNLTCTCKDWTETRKIYPVNDPRRLCKHLISQLDINDLPLEIKRFQASIQLYQDKKKGYNKYIDRLIEIPETDFVAEYNDGDWINVFDNESNRYGFLIKDDEYIWSRSSKTKNYKIIETFFAQKEYQPVVPLTGEKIKNIESSLENKFNVEEGHYVITTKERPYDISAKNQNLETYYDMMHITNEAIFIEVQGEKYTFLRDEELVQNLINKLIQKRLPKIYVTIQP